MNAAFIPVRGGSKSIPLKNIKPICGKPLVYWTVKAACECRYIDKVYIATDSEAIKNTVEAFKSSEVNTAFDKAMVIGRSKNSATDTASTETAMLEFAMKYEFDNIVLIQATSPLLQGSDLNKGFEMYEDKTTDSVLSVVRQKRFHWANNDQGFAEPTNYDVFNRPRRQEFEGYFVENGAFYITSRERLLKYKNRVSGNIRAVEMNEDSFFEIDEPSDWIIIEALMKKNGLDKAIEDDNNIIPNKRKMPEIKMLLTDCDGCLTDGGMYYSENGDELKRFNAKDGMAFKLLREKGIICGIITGEDVNLNRRRAKKLKLDILINGCDDKAKEIRRLSQEYGIDTENILYIGDDINDIGAMNLAGYSCCPKDAMKEVKKAADYITFAEGGKGVIREVTEMLINNSR